MSQKEATKKAALDKELLSEKFPLKFTFEDSEYQFHPDAPEQILFDGKAWTHKQIVENESVLIQILGGNLDLITKI